MDYREYADYVSNAYGVPSELFRSLITSESSWNPMARSPTGPLGIAQFTVETGKAYGLSPLDRLNPYKSLDAAARYLRDLLARFGGDARQAIAAYKGVSKGGATMSNVDRVLQDAKIPEGPISQKTPSLIKDWWRKLGNIFLGTPPPEQYEGYEGSIPLRVFVLFIAAVLTYFGIRNLMRG